MLAVAVLESARGLRLPPSAVLDYVLQAIEHPMFYRIELEERAALDFVRGRRVAQLGGDPAFLYAAARRRDVLHGWVHRLLDAWKAPPRGDDNVVVFGTRTPAKAGGSPAPREDVRAP